MTKIWTRTEIEIMLNTNDSAVERGIVAVWKRQTQEEQTSETTRHKNGCGFSGWTAKSGTYFANWINSGRHLSGKHMTKARKICLHHAGQITDIANKVR